MSLEETRMTIATGADTNGLVSKMPSGPGVIPLQTIRDIATHVSPSIETFLLTSETRVEKIIDQH